jgi:hypothetical protein
MKTHVTTATATIAATLTVLGLCFLSSCAVTVEDPTPDTVRTTTATQYDPYSGTTTTTRQTSEHSH